MLRPLASLAVLVAVAGIACTNSLMTDEAAASGATEAPDGAPGFCCPARTGGCALSGGYRESGVCPKDFDICDNMCAQRIEKDEHGCDVLRYEMPPVRTTYAGTASCSDPRFNGGRPGPDAGADAGGAASADASFDAGGPPQ